MKFNLILLSFTIGIVLTSISCSNSKSIKSDSDTASKSKDKDATQTDMEKLIPIYNSDFYASSKDNTWNLRVNYNEGLVFTDTKNNIQFFSDKVEKTVAQGANVVSISSENDTYTVQINIDVVDCMKGGRDVNIMVREKKKEFDYSGCGIYRGTPQLHDIWVLDKLNGEVMTAEKFPKELPHFEFDLKNQKMSGFAGCNQVNGTLKFDYNRIIIDPLLSTRMYCEDISKIEDEILKILRNHPVYHFENLRLFIETTDGSLVLKKND